MTSKSKSTTPIGQNNWRLFKFDDLGTADLRILVSELAICLNRKFRYAENHFKYVFCKEFLMTDIDKITQELKTLRDEVALKIHLGSKDMKHQWDILEKKYDESVSKMKLDETTEGIGAAGELMLDEIQKGYKRIKSSIS
jgi:hypothetical protein